MAVTGSGAVGAVIGKRRYTRKGTLPKIGEPIMAMRGGRKNTRGGKKKKKTRGGTRRR